MVSLFLSWPRGRRHTECGMGNLPSSNSNSWSNSKLLRFSGSYLEDLFLRRASQSGSGRAVDGPATVYLCSSVEVSFCGGGQVRKKAETNYTGTAPGFVNFMVYVDVAWPGDVQQNLGVASCRCKLWPSGCWGQKTRKFRPPAWKGKAGRNSTRRGPPPALVLAPVPGKSAVWGAWDRVVLERTSDRGCVQVSLCLKSRGLYSPLPCPLIATCCFVCF
jgi:hypothetical protein